MTTDLTVRIKRATLHLLTCNDSLLLSLSLNSCHKSATAEWVGSAGRLSFLQSYNEMFALANGKMALLMDHQNLAVFVKPPTKMRPRTTFQLL
jgi:hypothetical protein